MKVSIYVRERGTRKQKKHNPKKSYPQDGSIIWFLRYGSTWETVDVKTLSEATSLRLRRQIELDGGWRPTTKVTEAVLMLNKARDVYLAQIEKGRKPKTYDAYNKSLNLTSHDWPQYTEEEPEIYEQETLDKFFAACDEDELVLFETFLMSGMREQEMIYATDKSLDL